MIINFHQIFEEKKKQAVGAKGYLFFVKRFSTRARESSLFISCNDKPFMAAGVMSVGGSCSWRGGQTVHHQHCADERHSRGFTGQCINARLRKYRIWNNAAAGKSSERLCLVFGLPLPLLSWHPSTVRRASRAGTGGSRGIGGVAHLPGRRST